MTLSKASLGKALTGTRVLQVTGSDELAGFVLDLADAARFTERLLPGICRACQGFPPCSNCGDSGQLWDEGLVEVVAAAWYGFPKAFLADLTADQVELYRDNARAVLSALAGAVGKTTG